MRFIKAFTHYFELNRTERRGIFVLLVLLLGLLIFRYSFTYFIPSPILQISQSERAEMAALFKRQKDDLAINDGNAQNFKKSYTAPTPDNEQSVQIKLSNFDPNTASLDDFRTLGMTTKLAKTIIHYRDKGGQFRKKEDLHKIYGMNDLIYDRLAPYIQLPEKSMHKTEYANNFNQTPRKIHENIKVELNAADSEQMLQIRGIGPSFAGRILKYRRRLGGFQKKSQLLEVWGLDSQKYHEIENQIIINPQNATGIDINHCTFDDLKHFPYLRYKQSNAIIRYREQHGAFHSANELSNIYALDTATIRKVTPYILIK